MNKELKAFLTDLRDLLEKHNAQIVPTDVARVWINGEIQSYEHGRFEYLSIDDISEKLASE